jgi:hypothetical protein
MGTRTPQDSRARLHAALDQALDRILPPNEGVPLRLQTFLEFEEATEEHAMPVLGMILEELASLAAQARGGAEAGCCPHCGSADAPAGRKKIQREVRSRWGPVVYEHTPTRCRQCRRPFSPSAP